MRACYQRSPVFPTHSERWMSASPQTTGARQRAIIPLHAVTYRPLDLTLDRHCRRPLDARCTLALFHGDQNEVNCFDARTRNITFGGLSVAGKLASPVQRDRPIEVAIDRPDGRKTHLAGVVAYCKPVERDRVK